MFDEWVSAREAELAKAAAEAVPAGVLMLPWALLALLLRVKTVWIPCGLLMLYTIGQTSVDLSDGVVGGPSLLAFFLTFIVNLVFVGAALVIDLAIRGVRRARRTRSRTSDS